MSRWHWEKSNEGALFPPTVSGFLQGWRAWAGVLEEGPPPVAELFAREFIQNFVDAADELAQSLDSDSTPTIEFRFLRFTGSEAQRVRSALGLDDHVGRYQNLPSDARKDQRLSDSQLLRGEDDELALMVAVERFSTGMYGPWKADGRAISKDGVEIRRKMRDALVKPSGDKSSGSTIGSYGEGKKGVMLGSRIRTLFAYTCFQPTDVEPDVTNRLLGVTYWRKHVEDVWEYTGLALHGKLGQDGETERAEPYENDEAAAVVESWGVEGLSVRDPSRNRDLGTTWVFVEPAFDAAELASAVERSWWPRLEDDELHVSVVGFDREEHRVSARERVELRPFVEAYNIATGQNPPRDRIDLQRPLRVNGESFNEIGNLGLTVELADDGWSWDNPDNNAHMVALVRSGMVIQYETFPRKRRASIPPFVRGSFVVAPGEPDNCLKYAEPPVHNHWEEEFGKGYPEESVDLAKKTYLRLSAEVREFAKRFQVEPPPRDYQFDLFARWFRTSDEVSVVPPPDPPPPPTSDPWEIRVPKRETRDPNFENDDLLRVTARRTLRLKSDWRDENLKVRVRLTWRVLEENDLGADAPELLDLTADQVPAGFSLEGDAYVGFATKEPVEFEWTSRFYEADWLIRAHFEVESVTGEDQ